MDNIGGCIIVRPEPIKYWPGKVQGLTLMSDLHIGASNVDYKLITQELNLAKANGDRVVINGDVFDAIMVRDKRFSPEVIHPRLRGSADVVNAVLDMAEEILFPYADLIDMIGVGNHEETLRKNQNIDLIKLLLDRLDHHRTVDGNISHGGYNGFIDYRFRNHKEANGHGKRFVIYYHHGTGGASPVTKGTSELNKKMWVEADVIWLGHTHTKLSAVVQVMKCPQAGHEPVMRELRQVITGSYFDVYKGQSQESIRRQGRRTNYAADSGMEPQGKGGARLELTFNSEDKPFVVKVVH